MAGAILLLFLNSEWLVPMALVLGAVYLVYFGVRTVVVGSTSERRVREQRCRRRHGPSRTTSPHRRRRHGPRVHWRDQARESLRPQTVRPTAGRTDRVVPDGRHRVGRPVPDHPRGRRPQLDASVDTWTFFTWLTVSSVAGAWLVLGLAKFWEGHEGDDILRRFVMMVAGLAIGVAAFAASDVLMVRLSTNEMFNVLDLPVDLIPKRIYASDGTPGLTPFLAYFATLFLVSPVVASGGSLAEDAVQPVGNHRVRLGRDVDPLADPLGVPAGDHHLGGRATVGSLDVDRANEHVSGTKH